MRAAAEDGYTTATSVADALVREGVPFRAAHGIVGTLVARAETDRVRLGELPGEAYAEALGGAGEGRSSDLAGDAAVVTRLREAATVEAALAGCDVVGGTAPRRVGAALDAARMRLEA
jgi:argininosuccinate lyase